MIMDFLYIDKKRLSIYLSQINKVGHATSVKKNQSSSSYNTSTFEGSLKFAGAKYQDQDSITDGNEVIYDTSWSFAVNAINEIRKEIKFDEKNLRIGQLFESTFFINIIDIKLLNEMMDLIREEAYARDESEFNEFMRKRKINDKEHRSKFDILIDSFSRIPPSMQLYALGEKFLAWSTLDRDGMIVNPNDLHLKHGTKIAGAWDIIAIIDCLPRPPNSWNMKEYVNNDIINNIPQMMENMRHQLGRPDNFLGITPLAIFRKLGES